MSKLGFGCMRLPQLEKEDARIVDIELFKQLVDVYMENGFSYFDTAYKYWGGLSEPAVKQAVVDRYPRESYTLATKLSSEFMHTKEEQSQVFDDQITRLGVDYFDYYLLHNLGEVNYRTSLELDSFEFAKQKKAEGKVRHIGISYHGNAELLDQILTAHPEIEVVQLQINYLDWDNESIQSRKCWEVARRHDKPVIVMEPIKGGTLAKIPQEAEKLLKTHSPERSVASWAMRFAASHEGVMMVLSGMNSMEQLEDNIRSLKNLVPFSAEEYALARQVAQIISNSGAVPCTSCGYCTVECPQNIPIPNYLALYQEGYFSTQFAYYFNLVQKHSRAGDCVSCKKCEDHCPQHIEITKYLAEISKKFDSFKGYR